MKFIGLDPAGVDEQASRAHRAGESMRSVGETLHAYLSSVGSLDLLDGLDEGCASIADDISACCDHLREKATEMVAADQRSHVVDQGFGVLVESGLPGGGMGATANFGDVFPKAPMDPNIPGPPTIPGPPADPPLPPGDGSGEHGDYRFDRWKPWEPDRELYKLWKKWQVFAAMAEGLMPDASRHMKHYLGNSGKDLCVNVEKILVSEKEIAAQVQAQADAEVAASAKKARETGKAVTFQTDWTTVTATTDNWGLALGSFSYSITGVATIRDDGAVVVEYRVHVFDRYNWDAGKETTMPGASTPTEDTELGSLHKAGVAQEYVIRGTSCTKTVVVE